MDIDLARLGHMLAIARLGSFSRAADELGITQPALSRSVRLIEDRYGLRLFDRGRAGAKPTAVGQQVIAQAAEVLRGAQTLDLNLRLLAGGEAGVVALGLGPMMASLVLPGLARHFLDHSPGVQLRTSIRTPATLMEELLDDQIELVLGNSWSLDLSPEISVEPIGEVTMRYVVRRGHPLTINSALSLDDLRDYPLATASVDEVKSLAPRAGAFVCDNFHIIRELVAETDMVWRTAPAIATQEGLVVLDIVGQLPLQSEVSLITRRGRTLSPGAKRIVQKTLELLGPK